MSDIRHERRMRRERASEEFPASDPPQIEQVTAAPSVNLLSQDGADGDAPPLLGSYGKEPTAAEGWRPIDAVAQSGDIVEIALQYGAGCYVTAFARYRTTRKFNPKTLRWELAKFWKAVSGYALQSEPVAYRPVAR